jgi:glycosyltransferase involved in cell wall biosynthesis
MKIVFLIRSLNRGGSERQLAYLANLLKDKGHDIVVATFYEGGYFAAYLQEKNIRVKFLEKKSRWDILGFFLRLIRWLRYENPDILHSYLVTSNILAILAKKLLNQTSIVLGIRASRMNLENYDLLSKITYKVECILARYSDLIISNSEEGKRYAIENRVPGKKITVIENGIDTEVFFIKKDGTSLLRTLNIDENTKVIGNVSRIDPIKDHRTFLYAAKILLERVQNVVFICVGDGDPNLLYDLKKYSENMNIHQKVLWLGNQDDMCDVYNSFDIMVLSSSGEGFPNSVCEAMACGVPCVTTDVGDCAKIVGNCGKVVPIGDSRAIASAVESLLSEDYWKLAIAARNRIVENYSLMNLANKTEEELFNVKGYASGNKS